MKRKKITARDKVLKRYPNAYVCNAGFGQYVVVSDAAGFDVSAYCERPSKAWLSAARNVTRSK